jgi:hypothetical protein
LRAAAEGDAVDVGADRMLARAGIDVDGDCGVLGLDRGHAQGCNGECGATDALESCRVHGSPRGKSGQNERASAGILCWAAQRMCELRHSSCAKR